MSSKICWGFRRVISFPLISISPSSFSLFSVSETVCWVDPIMAAIGSCVSFKETRMGLVIAFWSARLWQEMHEDPKGMACSCCRPYRKEDQSLTNS